MAPGSYAGKLGIVLACGLLVATGCEVKPKTARISPDQRKLHGTWRVVSAQFDGEESPRGPGDTYKFQGNRVTSSFLLDGEHITLGEMTYVLRPEKSPAEMDVVATGDDDRILYIYRFDGPKLVLCMEGNGVRPTEFVARRDDDQLLLELERVTEPTELTPPKQPAAESDNKDD